MTPGQVRTMTREFHVGGSDKGTALARKVRATWRELELQALRIEEFRPLLSYPDMERGNEVRLTKGSRVLFQLTPTARDSQLETQPYIAYSSPGKVRGKPVYTHFGQPEDFDALKSKGVTLNGTIAIMRYGKGDLLAKIKRAEDNGIKGVLIYGDPLDSEWESVDPLESGGPPVPWDAVQRSSLKSFPGDPATPFLPASRDMHRLPRADVQLPAIPIQPISAGDAQHLLRDMGGPIAPVEWQGRLNITFAIGPGYKDAAE
ncbi:N-acetylated-alpha-linked acidic dipeptidase protein-like, partial [Tropilaelaps mercedesae]